MICINTYSPENYDLQDSLTCILHELAYNILQLQTFLSQNANKNVITTITFLLIVLHETMSHLSDNMALESNSICAMEYDLNAGEQ